MSTNAKPYGLIAEFENTSSVLHAAENVRNAGFRKWDVFTPFPIHGMDKAMGIKIPRSAGSRSSVDAPGTTGMLMIWWMNAVDYQILVGGKPMFSPHGAFPPSYELTILFGAFGAIGGMLFLNRLPKLHHPLLKAQTLRLGDA